MFFELHSCVTLKIDFSIHACFISPVNHKAEDLCVFYLLQNTDHFVGGDDAAKLALNFPSSF
jgi:hypothetical protein